MTPIDPRRQPETWNVTPLGFDKVVEAFDRGLAPMAIDYHPFGVRRPRDFGTCAETHARGQGEMRHGRDDSLRRSALTYNGPSHVGRFARRPFPPLHPPSA